MLKLFSAWFNDFTGCLGSYIISTVIIIAISVVIVVIPVVIRTSSVVRLVSWILYSFLGGYMGFRGGITIKGKE